MAVQHAVIRSCSPQRSGFLRATTVRVSWCLLCCHCCAQCNSTNTTGCANRCEGHCAALRASTASGSCVRAKMARACGCVALHTCMLGPVAQSVEAQLQHQVCCPACTAPWAVQPCPHNACWPCATRHASPVASLFPALLRSGSR